MSLLHVCLLPTLLVSAALYDFQRTSVHSLNVYNFDKQVSKQRVKLAAIVHFYREHDSKSHHFVEELNALAKDWQGAFVFGAVNCDENEGLCETQDIRAAPVLKIYPPLPGPIYEYEGERTAKSIISKLANYLSPQVSDVTAESIKAFLEAKNGTPKVLLFTEKSGTPTIYKALSNVLSETLDFGIVRKDQSALVSKYGITSFPKLILLKSPDSKPKVYEGDMKYRPIFEFLNIYSEVFVIGETEDQPQQSSGPKPWRNELVPELNSASASDICFGSEGLLCAVFIVNGKINSDQTELFRTLRGKAGSQIAGRGVEVSFMWLDSREHTKFVQALEGVSAPALVYIKHGAKNRFFKHTGSLTQAGIEAAISKIAGGDAKFTLISGKFPEFGRT